jgi:MFS family permease
MNMLLGGILVPLVAIVIGKFGTKKTIISGISVLLFGLILLGTITSQLWQWIILWGVIVSLGMNFTGLVPIQTTLMFWFNKRRATAIGIVMTGAPAGGFIAQPFYTWLMNYTQSWQIGWIVGAILVATGFVLSIFLIAKPQEIGQHVDGLDPDKPVETENKKSKAINTYRSIGTWELGEVIRTRVFGFIVIFWIGHVMPIILITSHGVLHFTDKNFTSMEAASILSTVILGSAISRFPVGWLGDRIEPRHIINISMCVMLISFLGLWKLTNFDLIIITGFVFGLCHGSQLIMMPALIGNYFGPDRFAGINGAIGPFSIGFTAIVPVGAGYLFEKTGNYNPAFMILIVVLSIAFLATFFLSPPVKKSIGVRERE